MGWDPNEFFTGLAASDWVCEQLALYEMGGLADFIDVRAGEDLLARSDRLDEWHPAAMRGFTIDDFQDDRLLVTELGGGEVQEVLNIGTLSDRDRGAPVLGRVVPISTSPGLMFDVRPVDVDLETAREASQRAEDGHDLGWLDAISRGRAAKNGCPDSSRPDSELPWARTSSLSGPCITTSVMSGQNSRLASRTWWIQDSRRTRRPGLASARSV